MSDIIDELRGHDGCGLSASAPAAGIDAVAALFGTALPEDLLRLWRTSDGMQLDPLDAHLLGPSEVMEIIDTATIGSMLVKAGLVPILDDHESNLLAVAVREPLAYRVVDLPHDDGPRLIYHDIKSCLRAVLEAMDGEDSAALFLHETEGDYPPTTMRSEEDHQAARTLLATMEEGNYWNFAAQLLDATTLKEWETLLDTGHFVRRDILQRLRRMDSPGIRELLRRDEEQYEEFVLLFTTALREAGLEIGKRKGTVLQIGKHGFELDTFFHRRREPHAIPSAVARISEAINGPSTKGRAPDSAPARD